MVLVISKDKKALSPTSNARARVLLKRGKAVVHRIYPFVIRLKEKKSNSSRYTVKIDPGASTTGVAIVDRDKALFFFELIHRGKVIKKSLDTRRVRRRSRRYRKTRYRKPRFLNRTRPDNWLAPSVKSRADNIVNFVKKISRYISLDKAIIERVSFDTSSMTQGKRLYGREYQKGSLYQTKIREYIFNKYNKQCVYCGSKDNLEIEHIVPKTKGGTNSVFNLTLSCRKCNELKGKLSLDEFGKKIDKDLSYLKPKNTPKDASIIQSARDYTIKEIKKLMSVETAEGWKTSFYRKENNLPKEHYYDALCVKENLKYQIATKEVLIVKAQGRGSRQMTRVDRFGFPRTSAKKSKFVNGFQTGDIVKATIDIGKKRGVYLGRVAVRSSGYFNIATKDKTIQGVKHSDCSLIQRNDGYSYQIKKVA